MIFTSTLFLLFFLCVYVIYWAYDGKSYREWVIVIASLVFYATWSVPFLFHLLGILYINYLAIRSLFKRKSLRVLRGIIVLDLINLGVFKYFYFLRITSTFGRAGVFWIRKISDFRLFFRLRLVFIRFRS